MAGYTLKAEEFQQWVEADADKFQPVGEKLHEYDLGQPSTKYIITKVRVCHAFRCLLKLTKLPVFE